MKLSVDQLTTDPAPFSFQGDAAWWSSTIAPARDLPSELLAPFRFEGVAYRMAESLLLEGRAEGALELECGRCLARYRHQLREAFRLVLEPGGDRLLEPEAAEALARDGICLGEELEAGWYRGPELELSAFFGEVVALGLPVVALCREDCAGLCPQCGVDRNVGSCECQETRADSPFAALAALRRDR
jgi:uncharacterized protein